MNILFGALLLPLLISAEQDSEPALDSAKEALKLFLLDGTWFNFKTQTECNDDSFFNGGIKPDNGIEHQMNKLDSNNVTITRAMYINEKENLVLFFVPEISRFFTATKQPKYIISSEFQLTNDQYYCAALGIAQNTHNNLANFGKIILHSTIIKGIPRRNLTYAEKWDRSYLHNPVIYQESDQPDKVIFKKTCTNDDAELINRAKNDQILRANFVEGSDFKKIKYTAVTWDRELKKYGMITEFTLEEIGSRYEYTHLKDMGIML